MSKDQAILPMPNMVVNSTDLNLYNNENNSAQAISWLTNRGEVPIEEFFQKQAVPVSDPEPAWRGRLRHHF